MKTCEEFEADILLLQSGESDTSAELASHLESCAACAAFARSSADIIQLAAEQLPTASPSDELVATIMEEARAQKPGKRIEGPWLRVVAMAACFAIIAGAVALLRSDRTDPIAEPAPSGNLAAAADVRALIQVYDDAGAETTLLDDDRDTAESGDEFDSLAQELLELQGFGSFDSDALLLSSI